MDLERSLSFLGRCDEDALAASETRGWAELDDMAEGFIRCPQSMSSPTVAVVLGRTGVKERLRLTVIGAISEENANGSLRSPGPFREGERDLLR